MAQQRLMLILIAKRSRRDRDNMAFGYVVNMVGTDSVEVELAPGDLVILSVATHNQILATAKTASEYQAAVAAAKNKSDADWKAERGPDSELGRNMEAGNPVVDHSSDPVSDPRD